MNDSKGPWYYAVMVMLGLFRRLGLVSKEASVARSKRKGIAHDFTFKLAGQELSLIKQLEGGFRVFLVGLGSHPVVDDLIVTRTKTSTVRYRIEKISYGVSGSWRAYGRLEHRPSHVVKTRYGHPRSSMSVV